MDLIIGFGNPMRGDDNAGHRVAGLIADAGRDGVRVVRTQQLTPELAEDIAQCDRVVFIDAAEAGPEIDLQPVSAPSQPGTPASSSHHLAPGDLLALTRSLYHRRPEAILCTIRGESFSHGDELSPGVQPRALEAAARILDVLSRPANPAARE